MKNLNETNIEVLKLNEMINTRGGDHNPDTVNDGHDGDVIFWE